MANKKVIIDNRMRIIEKQKFKDMGYEIVEVQTNTDVYPEISSHVDIWACKVGNEIIVEPTQKLKNISNLVYGKEKVLIPYPADIKYNVCVIGKKAINNLKFIRICFLSNNEKEEYKNKRLANNNSNLNKVKVARIEYRGKGQYIDEFLK